jgi:hypothetical protein
MEIIRAYLLKMIVQLAQDPVPTVRTTWSKVICPLIKYPSGRWSRDRDMIFIAHQLLLDSDREVVAHVSLLTYAVMDDTVVVNTAQSSEIPKLRETADCIDTIQYGDSLTDWLETDMKQLNSYNSDVVLDSAIGS